MGNRGRKLENRDVREAQVLRRMGVQKIRSQLPPALSNPHKSRRDATQRILVRSVADRTMLLQLAGTLPESATSSANIRRPWSNGTQRPLLHSRKTRSPQVSLFSQHSRTSSPPVRVFSMLTILPSTILALLMMLLLMLPIVF